MQSKYVYKRFISIILPICVAVFVVTIAIFEWSNYSSARQALSDRLNELSATYSLLYAAPVEAHDIEKINLYTISLITNPDVAYVCVTNIKDKPFDEYGSSDDANKSLLMKTDINFASEVDLHQAGKLILGLSTTRIDNELQRRIREEVLLLLILVVAVLISVGIAFKLAVGKPMRLLSYQATHDPLTGLYNRLAFEEQLVKLNDKSMSAKSSSLLVLDLDHFKIINDSCGHAAGDEALMKVTSALQSQLRNGDVIARLGGDEFGILLMDCDAKTAALIAEKIRTTMEQFTFNYDGHDFNLSVSIGVLPLTDNSLKPKELLSRADEACYMAKKKGRNLVYQYRPA